jgi:hypothetical protein
MSPFCEVCEVKYELIDDHSIDCIICGQSCCKNCIDEFYICRDCSSDKSNVFSKKEFDIG